MQESLRNFLGSFAIGIATLGTATAAYAEDMAQRLTRVLEIAEVARVMHDEGMLHGQDLDDEMLGGLGGAYWQRTVEQIYDVDQFTQAIGHTLVQAMDAADIEEVLAFFETELGQRILGLETAARVAMSDPDVEEIARSTYADLQGSDSERLKLVARLVDENDLLERNVAGTLSSSYQFYKGLVDGGGLEMSEDDILAEVWNSEDDVRQDTDGWLFGFLLMAYRPLEKDELQDYITFSSGPAGQALNAALFEGFDVMFNGVSYALGVSLAHAMDASDL